MPIYPYVEFVLTVGTWTTDGEAWPDTGFEGGVAIPFGAGREVLADADPAPWAMADGTLRDVKTWPGTLELEGREFDVDVLALGERYLIGREVLDRLEICFEFGRQVRLRFGDEPLE